MTTPSSQPGTRAPENPLRTSGQPRTPRKTPTLTLAPGEVARLAARDCPPLTSAALQTASRQATATQPARPGSTARRAPRQPPW